MGIFAHSESQIRNKRTDVNSVIKKNTFEESDVLSKPFSDSRGNYPLLRRKVLIG